MNASTITTNTVDTSCSGSFRVSDDGFTTCVRMSASPSASNSDRTFTITPASNLSGNTTYKISIATEAMDNANIALESKYESPTGFTTITANGTVLLSFDSPADASFLAHDGTNLWCTTGSKAYEIDPETGSILSSFDLPAEVIPISGLTHDGTDLFSLSSAEFSGWNENEKIFRIDTVAKTATEIYNEQEIGGINWIFSLAYNGTNFVTFLTEYGIHESFVEINPVTGIAGGGSSAFQADNNEDPKIRGLTFDGNNYWGYSNGKILKLQQGFPATNFAPDMIMVTLSNAEYKGPGIAYGGNYLWVIGNNDKILKVQP